MTLHRILDLQLIGQVTNSGETLNQDRIPRQSTPKFLTHCLGDNAYFLKLWENPFCNSTDETISSSQMEMTTVLFPKVVLRIKWGITQPNTRPKVNTWGLFSQAWGTYSPTRQAATVLITSYLPLGPQYLTLWAHPASSVSSFSLLLFDH